eukprot:2496976-Pleurochrysis_carterae.AAC.4
MICSLSTEVQATVALPPAAPNNLTASCQLPITQFLPSETTRSVPFCLCPRRVPRAKHARAHIVGLVLEAAPLHALRHGEGASSRLRPNLNSL